MFLILYDAIGSVFSFYILLADFISLRFETIKVSKHYLTIYKGVLESFVHINGKKERLRLKKFANVIETKLPDSVKIYNFF